MINFKMAKDDLQFNNAMNDLTNKLAELFKKKERSLTDIEFFILKFLNSFEELNDYEIIGMLEQCKITYINVRDKAFEDEYDEECSEHD